MKKSGRGTHKAISIMSLIGFLLCSLLLLYPLISDRWNKYRDSKIIDSYIDEVNSGDPAFYEKELKKAHEYNETLYSQGRNIVSDAEYDSDEYYDTILNSTGTGIMCYIEIPIIGVTEPVFHYSNNYSLEHGVGHIHGSSIPIGGENTHSVLTGHRGLPSQKIFSDLDRVKKGDQFYIHVLGHTYAYRVCSIKVVLPNNVSDLMIEDGRDLITLVTCEPYGVNTHRLLVTGERVEFDESLVENGLVTTEEHKQIIDPAFMIFIGFLIFIIVSVITVSIKRLLNKKKVLLLSAENGAIETENNNIEIKEPEPLVEETDNQIIIPTRKIELTEKSETEMAVEPDKPAHSEKRFMLPELIGQKAVSLKESIREYFVGLKLKNERKKAKKRQEKEDVSLFKRITSKQGESSKKLNKQKNVPIFGFIGNKDKEDNKQSRKDRKAAVKSKYVAESDNTEQPVVVKKVYVVDDTPRRKRGPLFYITLGITIGGAIAGGIVFVYKLMKKRNNLQILKPEIIEPENSISKKNKKKRK